MTRQRWPLMVGLGLCLVAAGAHAQALPFEPVLHATVGLLQSPLFKMMGLLMLVIGGAQAVTNGNPMPAVVGVVAATLFVLGPTVLGPMLESSYQASAVAVAEQSTKKATPSASLSERPTEYRAPEESRLTQAHPTMGRPASPDQTLKPASSLKAGTEAAVAATSLASRPRGVEEPKGLHFSPLQLAASAFLVALLIGGAVLAVLQHARPRPVLSGTSTAGRGKRPVIRLGED